MIENYSVSKAEFFIDHLQLQPHPEGGYYKEIYRAAESIPQKALPSRFGGDRSFATAIYYLLQQGDFSAFHRIRSDESWHFYFGQTLLIHVIDTDKAYKCVKLGSDIQAGETFQFVVPATSWFAVEPAPASSFALVGCIVAPGFDFHDFEMADRAFLLNAFPLYSNVINRLCR